MKQLAANVSIGSTADVAAALAVFNMMTNGADAPSQGVMILQYVAFAGGLLALVGGLIMIAMAPED